MKKQTEEEELLHLCIDRHIRFIPRERLYPASGCAKSPICEGMFRLCFPVCSLAVSQTSLSSIGFLLCGSVFFRTLTQEKRGRRTKIDAWDESGSCLRCPCGTGPDDEEVSRGPEAYTLANPPLARRQQHLEHEKIRST